MKVTLDDLEQVARCLQVKVTYDDLRTSRGGSCRVMETRRIIINKHLPASEKASILARELSAFDLSDLDIPEKVRKRIELEADRGE